METRRKIGFSTKTFYKFLNPISDEALAFAHKLSHKTVEVYWHNHKSFIPKSIDVQLRYFQCASLHLPINMSDRKSDSFDTMLVLSRLHDFLVEYQLRYAVIHPNLITDWDEFHKLATIDSVFLLPLAIENMDDRKQSFRDLQSLLDFFGKYQTIKLVFDVNHWLVNGNSIESIPETLETILSANIQLVGIHLSGLGFHEPLFKTAGAEEIIKSLRMLPPEIPIIIESIFENADEPVTELAFIRKHL